MRRQLQARISSRHSVTLGEKNGERVLEVAGSTTPGTAFYSRTYTGSGTNYAVTGCACGAGADTNVGGYFFAAYGTHNYGLLVTGGSVGIGTETPQALLHVAGDVKIDGNIAAKYQDVAEWVKSRDSVSPGTVVVINESDTNVVESSQRSYDTAVAGVVSAQPGISLGEKGRGKVLVAQTGRVRVKVDASYGAGRAGDLLVTSPTPGYAMRSEPIELGDAQIHRPGTLLGKAIQPPDSGKGEILVLLTLQ
jgi:hypothetical protein